MSSSSIRSPVDNINSRIASFIPKSISSSTPTNISRTLSNIGNSVSRESKDIFNAFTPSSTSNTPTTTPNNSSYSSSSPSSPSSSSTSPVTSWFSSAVDEVKTETDEGSSPSFFSYLIRFILIAALLAFAGFNVFTQMGVITDDAVKFAEPIIRPIMGLFGMITQQAVKTTAEGTKTGIDIVSGATKSGISVIEDQVTGTGIQSTGNGDSKQERARANALTMKRGTDAGATDNAEPQLPEADDASSVTQKGKISGKAGYCLVGEDRGIRSCMKVGEGDTCMSGNIFPSKDKCINPNLRV
jgi:hypothetical protein